MWRINYKGMTLHEVLIMAYMNTVEAEQDIRREHASLDGFQGRVCHGGA